MVETVLRLVVRVLGNAEGTIAGTWVFGARWSGSGRSMDLRGAQNGRRRLTRVSGAHFRAIDDREGAYACASRMRAPHIGPISAGSEVGRGGWRY